VIFGELSVAGLLPALVSALAIMIVCVGFGLKTGCDNGSERSSWPQIAAAFKGAGIGAITKHLIPFMMVTVVVVFIITYFPQISLLPVKWIRGG
jgi:TRAP-type C4-dicarboxylate transport system permease large subunit